jgi:flagellar biosynthetic protein FliO
MDTNILQSFGVLILAVAVIAGIMFLIKKISTQRMESKTSVDLKVISKITLQPKNHLFVVKVADKTLVLGVTDNTINILTELDPTFEKVVNIKSNKIITDEIISKVANTSAGGNLNTNLSFANFLKSSIKLK